MKKVVGFRTYETIGVSQVNIRGRVKKMSLEPSHPMIVPPRRTPVAETDVMVKLYPDGYLVVMWRIGPASGGLGSYFEDRDPRWSFPSIISPIGEPWEALRDAVLLEAPKSGADGRGRSGDHDGFWRDFVREVEEIFPIVDVMYR